MESRRGAPEPGKNILVVDSDPIAGAQVAKALRSRGFDVTSAASSAVALKCVTAVGPAAVVVMLEPPESSSFLPLVRQLSTELHTQEIPVIVARCDDNSLLTQAQRIGNVVVLLGDCSPEAVATEVNRVLLEAAGPQTAGTRLHFPVTCPHCGKQTGLPRSVSTAANSGTYICLFCETCAKEWRMFRQADTPGIVES